MEMREKEGRKGGRKEEGRKGEEGKNRLKGWVVLERGKAAKKSLINKLVFIPGQLG